MENAQSSTFGGFHAATCYFYRGSTQALLVHK